MGGAPAATVVGRPSQPMANTVVRPWCSVVTSSLCPNRPVVSNAMPDGKPPGGRLANRRDRPSWLIMITPGRGPGSRAKAVSIPNGHGFPPPARLPARAR